MDLNCTYVVELSVDIFINPDIFDCNMSIFTLTIGESSDVANCEVVPTTDVRDIPEVIDIGAVIHDCLDEVDCGVVVNDRFDEVNCGILVCDKLIWLTAVRMHKQDCFNLADFGVGKPIFNSFCRSYDFVMSEFFIGSYVTFAK